MLYLDTSNVLEALNKKSHYPHPWQNILLLKVKYDKHKHSTDQSNVTITSKEPNNSQRRGLSNNVVIKYLE